MPDRYSEWPPRRGDDGGDILAALTQAWQELRARFGGAGTAGPSRLNPWLVVGFLLLVYLASGVYIVDPDERGVVLRFGRVARETEPGPHYRFRFIEEVLTPNVTQIQKQEIGFRTVNVGPPARYQEVPAEALMLTGDENIVKLEFIVQYRVKTEAGGTTDFLFNVKDPQQTVRDSAEAAMREVIGHADIDAALTEEKERVQEDAQRTLQGILDRYDSGIEVATVKLQDVDPPDQVSDTFKDVISAQQDKERMINEASGYANDVVPRARGQAAQLINEAEGYQGAKVRDAAGVAQRFTALQTEYEKAKEVTRRRLYLETMEVVLPKVNKVIIDETAAQQVVPYLPLDQALRLRHTEPTSEVPAGGR